MTTLGMMPRFAKCVARNPWLPAPEAWLTHCSGGRDPIYLIVQG